MTEPVAAFRALLLVAVASSVPWALGRILGSRWAWPLDFGYRLRDGKRLLGAHKTWRGLVGGVAACAVAGSLVGPGYLAGAAVGTLALVGDACSSAIKRRIGRPPGADVPGLDQVPEALLPLLVLHRSLGLSFASVTFVTLAFAVLDIVAAPLRHPQRKRYSR